MRIALSQVIAMRKWIIIKITVNVVAKQVTVYHKKIKAGKLPAFILDSDLMISTPFFY